MIKLRICVPQEKETEVVIDGDQATIGRLPDCDVQLPGAFVSKHHARILSGVVLCDMGSRNGVWVDGCKVEGAVLLEGNVFHLGADLATSPRIEIVEMSTRAASQALSNLQRENQRLEGRVADLQAQLDRLVRSDVDASRSDRKLAAPGIDAQAPLVAPSDGVAVQASIPVNPVQPASAPAKQPGAGIAHRVPSFQEFFGGANARSTSPSSAPPVPATRPPQAANPRTSDIAPTAPRASLDAPDREKNRQRILEMINRLIAEDVGDRPPLIEGPVDEFFTLESFRLLRKVEQVITYLAREMVQLYDIKTYLPSAEGNFRSLAADVLAAPTERRPREKLAEYLEDLRRWLGVSLTSHREAAQQFVRDLKQDLSTEALTKNRPVPKLRSLTGRSEVELWQRAQNYLRELSDDVSQERLEKHASRIAADLLDRKGEKKPG